jgi:hypothetical protein
MVTPQKIKHRATIWFSYFTTEYISKEGEISVLKKYLQFHVHCIIHNSQDMEWALMFTDGWMDKENVRCTHSNTHSGIIFSHTKDRISVICDNMINLKDYRHKGKCTIWVHLCVESKNLSLLKQQNGAVDWRVQSFSYAGWINSGDLIQHSGYGYYCIGCWKFH